MGHFRVHGDIFPAHFSRKYIVAFNLSLSFPVWWPFCANSWIGYFQTLFWQFQMYLRTSKEKIQSFAPYYRSSVDKVRSFAPYYQASVGKAHSVVPYYHASVSCQIGSVISILLPLICGDCPILRGIHQLVLVESPRVFPLLTRENTTLYQQSSALSRKSSKIHGYCDRRCFVEASDSTLCW